MSIEKIQSFGDYIDKHPFTAVGILLATLAILTRASLMLGRREGYRGGFANGVDHALIETGSNKSVSRTDPLQGLVDSTLR